MYSTIVVQSLRPYMSLIFVIKGKCLSVVVNILMAKGDPGNQRLIRCRRMDSGKQKSYKKQEIVFFFLKYFQPEIQSNHQLLVLCVIF
jgi:hypothetical protein